ncbi:MAG: hypothetical protein LBI29_02640 [Rickettsiales bacterium]|nr:hypothetical protein [Rickettsiales bacterium]
MHLGVADEDIANASRLMYEVLSGHSSDHIEYNERLPVTIDYLCTDGHCAYDSVYKKYKSNIGKHIASKSETCLVESLNSSIRDRLARLKRRTRAYSKSIHMLRISVNLWVHRDEIFANIDRYCGYNGYVDNLVYVRRSKKYRNCEINGNLA